MFRYERPMVGPPKTLYDLRKVEGAVRLTCRACKRRQLIDREELILMRHIARETCDWPAFCTSAICCYCTSRNVKVEIEAFANGLPELRRRRATMITIELALILLRAASDSGSRRGLPVEAVRLALRAVHPFLQDKALLTEFWVRYSDPDPTLGESPAGYYADIVRALLKRGYAVPAEPRI
ncbi:hypothetical protein [Sphingomonas dokdonensis]|nr:hypothetical protein [Sphingomonas dokdonensis]